MVHGQDPDSDHVSDCDHIVRILDVAVRHLTDVHQAAILQTNVDEGPEIDDIEHRPFQFHAGLQVLQLEDSLLENRRRQILARIAARPTECLQDIFQGRHADLQPGSPFLWGDAL